MLAAGRIMLNGIVAANPATMVDADDQLAVDGEAIAAKQPTRLWRYHKPKGLVTTARDPEGRPRVFAALPRAMPRVISVGRLDLNTEGLLLLTNDGGLARYLEHPAQGLSRTYRVRAHGAPSEAALARISKGIVIDGVSYRPAQITIDRRQGTNCWLTMTLHEGKNREIKRLLEQVGLRVTRLIRISYGPFELGALKSGAVEEVRPRTLAKLVPDYFGQLEIKSSRPAV